MADNVAVEPSAAPSAVDVATDDVGGRHFQIVKLAIGADGVATLIDAGLPITAASLPLPSGASTEATLAALKAVADTIASAAAAIKVAAEALDAKTTAVNTGAIAGTVALDATALAALAAAATPGTQPISGNVGVLGAVEIVNDAGNAIPVSAAALPLPAGAASETTLAAVNGKLPALSGGRIPVELPTGGGGLTDTELRASDIPVTDATAGNFLWRILQMLMAPLGYDKSLQRTRGTVLVESVSGTVTVGNMTSLNAFNGRNADMLINSNGNAAWALCVRARIT